MSPRALVTGCTGFVGGALTRALAREGWEVHGVVRPTSDPEILAELREICRLHVHDGTTRHLVEIVQDANPEIAFHLASLFLAEHQPDDVEALIHSNLLFSTQLVEATVRAGCKRMVNTGTSWQHYQTTDYCPVNLYAATKQAFEDILTYYHDAHGLSVITLKLFDTYGPGDRRRKLINILVDAATTGERLDMSPGEQTLDLTHVDDVVQAFLVAARLLAKSPVPIAIDRLVSGERYKLKALVETVEAALDEQIHASFGARAYRHREIMVLPAIESEELTGWKRKNSIAGYLLQLKHNPSRGEGA